MIVLALESATELAGAAIADEEGLICCASTSRGRRHAESVVPSIEFVCRRAGVELGDLDGICVDVGPGLFTGLRVGIATAKGLGFALGLPVVPVSSLEVLAFALKDLGAPSGGSEGARSSRLVVPVVDAKRGELFSAVYRAGAQAGDGEDALGGLERVEDERLSSPEDLALSLSELGEPFELGGDGARRFEQLLLGLPGASMANAAPQSPPVEVLAHIGLARLGAGIGSDASEIEPRYLREADVRINWERRPYVEGGLEIGLAEGSAPSATVG